MLVKTYLDKSKIHGIGLFAAEFIPNGKLVWKFVSGFDFVMTKKEVAKLPEVARSWVLTYGYYNKEEGGYVICADDARFFNHSDNSNTDNTKMIGTIASKDIKKGEEITCNYKEFVEEGRPFLKKKIMR